jgi:hypothetical protein
MNCRIAANKRLANEELTSETHNHADELNLYKIEKWTKDGSKEDCFMPAAI